MAVYRASMAIALFSAASLAATLAGADQELVATPVERPPVIDGVAAGGEWSAARSIVTRDAVADINIALRSQYTREEIFFLVSYPDATENREHKTMVWDRNDKYYRVGPTREDTFVFKWNLEPIAVDLTLSSPTPYKADIWFWKAFRTDPSGHADDKMHLFSATPMPRANRLFSRSGHIFYLLRPGDEGQPAYRPLIHSDYEGPSRPRYAHAMPTGSRADIRAKGVWRDGTWTIEFARKLNTGNTDDIAFDPAQTYVFGVSRYEVAGRKPDPQLQQPHYGSGEVGERLILRFR